MPPWRRFANAFSKPHALMENDNAGGGMLEIATRVSKQEICAVCEGRLAVLGDAGAEHGERTLPSRRSTRAFAAALVRGVCDPPLRAVNWLTISEFANPPEVARLLDEVGRELSSADVNVGTGP
jgi:hypothetical protein